MRLELTEGVNLVKYGQLCTLSKSPWRAANDYSLVLSALLSVNKNTPFPEVEGARAVLRVQVRLMRWRTFVWKVPVFTDAFDYDNSNTLADSIIITSMQYSRFSLLDDDVYFVASQAVHGLRWYANNLHRGIEPPDDLKIKI